MPRTAVIALILSWSAASAQGLEPAPVTFFPGGAEAAGCRAQWQTRAPVVARSAPTELADAIRGIDALRRVDANDYTEALTAVLEPGLAVARQPVTLGDARPLGGGPAETLRLDAGEAVALYTDAWMARLGDAVPATFTHRGRTYRAVLTDMEAASRPVAEVWVRLVARDDRPAAWFNTAQAGVVAWDPACE